MTSIKNKFLCQVGATAFEATLFVALAGLTMFTASKALDRSAGDQTRERLGQTNESYHFVRFDAPEDGHPISEDDCDGYYQIAGEATVNSTTTTTTTTIKSKTTTTQPNDYIGGPFECTIDTCPVDYKLAHILATDDQTVIGCQCMFFECPDGYTEVVEKTTGRKSCAWTGCLEGYVEVGAQDGIKDCVRKVPPEECRDDAIWTWDVGQAGISGSWECPGTTEQDCPDQSTWNEEKSYCECPDGTEIYSHVDDAAINDQAKPLPCAGDVPERDCDAVKIECEAAGKVFIGNIEDPTSCFCGTTEISAECKQGDEGCINLPNNPPPESDTSGDTGEVSTMVEENPNINIVDTGSTFEMLK